MKNYLISLSVFMSIGSLLFGSSLRYECENDWAKMIFSESSMTGESYFIFESVKGDGFQMQGELLNVDKTVEKIRVSGEVKTHSRYKTFVANLPFDYLGLGRVEGSIVFHDHYGMPLLSPPFSCAVERVLH
jgi:hypothetical protein